MNFGVYWNKDKIIKSGEENYVTNRTRRAHETSTL